MEPRITITAMRHLDNGGLQSDDSDQPAVTLRQIVNEDQLLVYIEGWPHGFGANVTLPLSTVKQWLLTAAPKAC